MSTLRTITSQNIKFVYRRIINPKYISLTCLPHVNYHHTLNTCKHDNLCYPRTSVVYVPVNKYVQNTNNTDKNAAQKPGLVARFKQMYKDYWYVLLPVHFVTSAAWFGGFYYAAKSGVDIVGILETIGVNDKFINPLRDSTMGYLAISYALYKIFTPLRYMVTIGGTTISINYLRNRGYIKPVPSKEKLREMFDEKRGELRDTFQETKMGLSKRKTNITEDLARYKEEIKKIKTQVKSNE